MHPDITLAILAGGEGLRAGGPKSLLSVVDKPILEYLFRRFTWHGPTLLVTGPNNRHPPGAELFDLEATDDIAGRGPLQGLLTALRACTTERLLLVPVDMPLLTQSQFLELGNAEGLGVLCRRRAGGEEIIEPFPGVFECSITQTIEHLLSQNRRSLHGLLKLPGFTTVDVSHWAIETWINLNTADDWSRYEKLLRNS